MLFQDQKTDFLHRSTTFRGAVVKLVYTSNFARCDFHPGVCNKLVTVHVARYLLMIGSSLSLTLWSVEHILQDVNRKAQNRTCKQSFRDKGILVP